MVQYAVFIVAAVLAVGAALAMVFTKNAVHSALFLVGVMLCLSIFFLLQGAFLVSVLQIIIYAGAIMVLFVFVVMLLGIDKQESLTEKLRNQRPVAIGLGLLLAAEVAYLALAQHIHVAAANGVATGARQLPGQSNVTAVARTLFTSWALPFEATSVLLVVAVVGVMVLARRKTI
jgi:NADH-quinone oxidoreductase subunit J